MYYRSLILLACLFWQLPIAFATVTIGSKTNPINNSIDKIFVDEYGRELGLRGFNVSGKVKLAEFNFKPFKNLDDARLSLQTLRRQVGSNVIRFTIAWEGVAPQIQTLDQQYLADISAQIKLAINMGFYVFVDYHTDLYSRHTFSPDSYYTGNGAPKWAVSKVFGQDDCKLICKLGWDLHQKADSAMRNAMRGFWYDIWAMDKNINNFSAKISGQHGEQCITLAAGKVSMQSCNNSPAQKFNIDTNSRWQSASDNKLCLQLKSNKLQAAPCNQHAAQQLLIAANGNIRPLNNINKCIEYSDKLILKNCQQANRQQQFIWLQNSQNQPANMAFIQQQFNWQLLQTAKYIKASLSAAEFAKIIGMDAYNEPFDGGMAASPKEWDNQILWPAYQKMRHTLDQAGWQQVPLWAEPLVYWQYNTAPVIRATGGKHLQNPPQHGYVFNPHFYDGARQSPLDFSMVHNGEYMREFDNIRSEARFLNMPAFVSEFGMSVHGTGSTDNARMVNAIYQGLEVSNKYNGKTRRSDFYTPYLGGTQWQWDIYHNQHNEIINNNNQRIAKLADGWNDENYSVVTDFGKKYNVDYRLIERGYVRAAQGNILQASYEALARDADNKIINNLCIAPRANGKINSAASAKIIIKNRNFLFASIIGKTSQAPSVLYWPRHLNINTTWFLSADKLINLKLLTADKRLQIAPDFGAASGHLINYQTRNSKAADIDFMLLLSDPKQELNKADLQKLQQAINASLQQQNSPLYFTGKMHKRWYDRDPCN